MLLTKSDFAPEQWGDWRFHMANLIRTTDALRKWIEVTPEEEEAIAAVADDYLWMVTPYYASLMHKTDSRCPIRRQALPHLDEMKHGVSAGTDPVGDTLNLKTRRVIHKYPNRVVMLVSDTCPVYCRHCTRKFHTTSVHGTYFKQDTGPGYDEDFEYIRSHPEIDDVLLTGGDPLFLSDDRLEHIVRTLRAIPHVNIIRLGSRYPVFLPQRITENLCAMLARHHPVWLNTHFNHPSEITAEAAEACDRLLRHGIPVQNQSVLLRSVNDEVEVMRALNKQLLKIRVRPYYLYHCDNVAGVSHFATTVEKGREIIEALTGHETGFSVPSYVIATKLGKIPLQNPYVGNAGGEEVMRNYRNETAAIKDYLVAG